MSPSCLLTEFTASKFITKYLFSLTKIKQFFSFKTQKKIEPMYTQVEDITDEQIANMSITQMDTSAQVQRVRGPIEEEDEDYVGENYVEEERASSDEESSDEESSTPLPPNPEEIPSSSNDDPTPVFNRGKFTKIDLWRHVKTDNHHQLLTSYCDEADLNKNLKLVKNVLQTSVYVPDKHAIRTKKTVELFYTQQQEIVKEAVQHMEHLIKNKLENYKKLVAQMFTKKSNFAFEAEYLIEQRSRGFKINHNMMSDELYSFFATVLYNADNCSTNLLGECIRQISEAYPQTYKQFFDGKRVQSVLIKPAIEIIEDSIEDCCICKRKLANVIFRQNPFKGRKEAPCKCRPRCCSKCAIKEIWTSYQKIGKFSSRCPICRNVIRLSELNVVEQQIPSKKRKSEAEAETSSKKQEVDKEELNVGDYVKAGDDGKVYLVQKISGECCVIVDVATAWPIEITRPKRDLKKLCFDIRAGNIVAGRQT